MPTYKDRTGEVKKMNCGMHATIIEYVNSHDITIKFEDGEILKHKFYGDFKNGKIDNPNLKTNYQDRVGTKKKMRCGLYATIIAYRKSTDIDVRFDDGVVVCNRMYQDFVRGEITHPKNKIDILKIIGLKSTMHCGMEATIIAYRNSGDIDVMFADGVIVNHRSMNAFRGKRIQHPKHKIVLTDGKELGRHVIGETRLMRCGMKATIIAYRNSKDIDLEFEDGTVVTNKSYCNFKHGSIGHPIIRPSASYPERVIAGYLVAAGIKFQTEWNDSALRGENGRKPLYFDFALFDDTDSILLLLEYQGAQHFQIVDSFGGKEKLELQQEYDRRKKEYAISKSIPLIEISFLNTTLEDITHAMNEVLSNYSWIKECNNYPVDAQNIKIVDLNTKRIGEVQKMNCGLNAKIVAYRGSSDIDIQFEDGTMLTHVSYRRFTTKELSPPQLLLKNRVKEQREGVQRMMQCGMVATITSYRNAFNIDVQFEDGTIRHNQTYSNFLRGAISNRSKKEST